MLPGKTIIRECTACAKAIEQHTIASGNTFGAKFWTDGRQEARMLPDQPWLVICPQCHAPQWIDELKEIGEIDPGESFAGAGRYELPSLEDYFAILGKSILPVEKERYVRLRMWWVGNDVRRGKKTQHPLSVIEISNLTAFVKMLDESNPNDLIMKAEAMRELGRFDVAGALLEKSVDQDYAEVVLTIRKLVKKKDPYVREMHFK
jgi:hypothetical protein